MFRLTMSFSASIDDISTHQVMVIVQDIYAAVTTYAPDGGEILKI